MVDQSTPTPNAPKPEHVSDADLEKVRDAYTGALFEMVQKRPDLYRALLGALGEARLMQIMDGAMPAFDEAWMICRILNEPLSAFSPRSDRLWEAVEQDVARLCTAAAHAPESRRRRAFDELKALADKYAGAAGTLFAVVLAVGSLGVAGISWTDAQTAREQARVADAAVEQLYQQGLSLRRRGEMPAAQESFEAAFALAGQRAAIAPGDADALLSHAYAAFYLADFHWRNDDLDAAEPVYAEYEVLTQRLYEADPSRPLFQAERAFGQLNSAIMDLKRGRLDAALVGFGAASEALATVSEGSGAAGAADVANARAWRADALLAAGRLEAALAERQAQIDIFDAIPAPALGARLERLNALNHAAGIALSLGSEDEAAALAQRGLMEAETLLQAGEAEGAHALHTRRRYVSLMQTRAELALAGGDAILAKLLLDSARGTETEGMREDDRIVPRPEIASFALLNARIALASGAVDVAEREAQTALDMLASAGLDIDSAWRRAGALEVLGAARAADGREQAAIDAWRLGLAELDRGLGHAYELPIRARLARRLGDLAEVERISPQLAAMGYAHPLDAIFWQETGGARAVERDAMRGEENEG